MPDDFGQIIEIIVKIFIFYGFLSLFNETKIIKIDNEIKESLYQNNLDFSKFETKHKIIAIYYINNNIVENENLKEGNNFNIKYSLIDEQIKLAKSHGIIGFGIVYDFIKNIGYNEIISKLLFYINILNFPFFIILNFGLNMEEQFETDLKQKLTHDKNGNLRLIENIRKYLLFHSYIKFREKYILGIFDRSYIFCNLIKYIRQYLYENKIYIYIIFISTSKQNLNNLNESDISIEFPSQDMNMTNNLKYEYFYNYYYYNLFRKDIENCKMIKHFFIINGSKPEKFYIILKKYLQVCNVDFQNNETLFLFNSWNNYKENFYLEPDKEYGYSYLNYFSKAIFNFDVESIYDLNYLKNKCQIAVQVHLFYEDLIEYIINKTNNIPVKFDLYISISSNIIYKNVENYINRFSDSNKFEILTFENKGRDVLPFLNQMKNKISYYKYICHLHTKKTKKTPEIGFLWRQYLFNNLLGNAKIISEILFDFENNDKLGFIFPETFYSLVKYIYILRKGTKHWMNFLFSKLFPGHKMGELLNFPAGNMFWAKAKAIFQIFTYDFNNYFPEEEGQLDNTIMHSIERIWLYLVKFNGFYYKIIFKFF